MANTRISDETALTSPATGDLLPIVDVSDTTDASSGTTKKITLANLLVGTLLPDASTVAEGIVEEATSAETIAGTAAGTLARLFVNPSNLMAWFADKITVETTTGTTHSLATVAGQLVLVWAKGNNSAGAASTITLKYNTVTKDTVTVGDNGGNAVPFSLFYTETPGAATQNITVEASAGTNLNVTILVVKIKTT